MKLRYRGIDYDYNPPTVTFAEGKVAGKYRGLDWRHHNLKTNLTLQPKFNLTYRGVPYYSQPVSAPLGKSNVTLEKRDRNLGVN